MTAAALSAALALTLGTAAARAQPPVLITPGATLEAVFTQGGFYEGPTWDAASGKLYFSELTPAARLWRLDAPASATIWLAASQGINGTYLARDGRLLAAQGNSRRILSFRIGPDGPEDQQVLAADNAWHPPNDLCQTPAGDIYFTTPDFASQATSAVFHLAGGGAVTPVISDMPLPNGLITSLDGSVLYVGDSSQKHWRSYPIVDGGGLGAGSVFFDPPTADTRDPDGISIDELGNLYFTGRGGVWIVSPQGQPLEMIPVPEFATNVTFGGADGRTLYITCDGRVYSLSMEVRGGQFLEDCNGNGRHDACDLDCQAAGLACTPGACGTSADCNANGVPDECEPDHDGVGDACDACPGTLAGLPVGPDGCSEPVPGDFDRDGDVDLRDYGRFQACLTGPALPQEDVACAPARLDADPDVDEQDTARFLDCLSGPNVPADPTCNLL